MLKQEPKQHTRLSLEEYYNLTGQTREILELQLFKIKHSMVLQGKLRPSGPIIDVLALKKTFPSFSFPIQNDREPLFFNFSSQNNLILIVLIFVKITYHEYVSLIFAFPICHSSTVFIALFVNLNHF